MSPAKSRRDAPDGGVLVLVVGPSGAGKDSLIRAAREAFAGGDAVVFPERVVTRDADPEIEPHASVDTGEFDRLEAAGAFAATWRAHGHAYGVPASIEADIEAGRAVVVNVSRAAVADLRRRFANVHVVLVTARSDVLADRLRARGREGETEIARRVARAEAVGVPEPPVTTIDNSAALATAVEQFLEILEGYESEPAASRG